MNNMITEMKYILEEINRINKEEEQISELEDSLVKITAMKQNKEKRMKRNAESLADLWDGSGRDLGQEEKGTTEDEMAGWHHRLNRHEFE